MRAGVGGGFDAEKKEKEKNERREREGKEVNEEVFLPDNNNNKSIKGQAEEGDNPSKGKWSFAEVFGGRKISGSSRAKKQVAAGVSYN